MPHLHALQHGILAPPLQSPRDHRPHPRHRAQPPLHGSTHEHLPHCHPQRRALRLDQKFSFLRFFFLFNMFFLTKGQIVCRHAQRHVFGSGYVAVIASLVTPSLNLSHKQVSALILPKALLLQVKLRFGRLALTIR